MRTQRAYEALPFIASFDDLVRYINSSAEHQIMRPVPVPSAEIARAVRLANHGRTGWDWVRNGRKKVYGFGCLCGNRTYLVPRRGWIPMLEVDTSRFAYRVVRQVPPNEVMTTDRLNEHAFYYNEWTSRPQ